ncbi:MAG: hypothetical protein D3923_16145 [Candidatus Electrothrix sp. AR3]|nr:hypothetical protein [Candidatus Electrothrix sp. AR3]
MKKTYALLAAGCLLAFSAPCQAQPGEVRFAVKGGTLGVGVEAALDLNPFMELRGGLNYVTFDVDTTISQVDYIFEPTFHTGSLMLDVHPFANAFHLTAGIYLNDNEMDIQGTYRKDLIPEEFSRYAGLVDQAKIKGQVEFDNFAPYLGIGWTSNHDSLYGLGINMDLGIMFQGAAEVTELYLDDPWGAGSNPATLAILAQEKQAIQDELDNYELYPVLSVSLSYRF